MSPPRAAPVLLLATLLVACGKASSGGMSPNSAQPPPPSSPQPGASPYATSPPQATGGFQGAPAAGYPQPTSVPFAAPPPPIGEAPGSTPREVQLIFAWMEMENNARLLMSGLSTCDNACRSLASMERAVRVVCSLVKEGERVQCDNARSRLRDARARVRESCGACSDGTRTDPDAPDP